MKVKPLKNNLLVKLEENEETTKSGIILVGEAKGESYIARIIETADCLEENQDVFLNGDRVLINKHLGVRVRLEDTDYLIISQKDV